MEKTIKKKHILVIAGPSGVGKETVVQKVLEKIPSMTLSISCTTRKPRLGEVDGVDYYFISDEKFEDLIQQNAFLEWAIVFNSNKYGTPKAPIGEAIKENKNIVLIVDVQGARQVREMYPDEAISIFLLPPSEEELVRRLRGRGTESDQEVSRRLEEAHAEMARALDFDYQIINNSLEDTVDNIIDIISKSKTKNK